MYILMTFWVIYIFYLWTVFNKKDEFVNNRKYRIIITVLFAITCLISVIFGSIKNVYNDLKYEYSCARSVAKYIEDNIEKGAVFICVDDTLCGSIIPYVDEEYYFYSLTSDSYYKYINWDENRNNGLQIKEYFDRIDKFLEENKETENLYIILNNVPEGETYKYLIKKELIKYEYMAARSYSEYPENYYIYKIIK